MHIRCLYDKLIPLDELKPHPKNRNKHPRDQIERLAKIFEYQGVRKCITVSTRSGFITAGHGRLLAAKHNKYVEFPVEYQDYDSEEQEIADLNADNAIALWAEMDFAGINADVPDLGPDFDIDFLGIKNFVIDPAEKGGSGDSDEIPDPPVQAKSQRGELYLLGNHRVLCGDAANESDFERLMDQKLAALVVTSPPYNQKLDGFKPSGMQVESPGWVKKMAGAYFDSLPESTYQQQQIDILGLIGKFTTSEASFFYNHKIRYRDREIVTPYSWLVHSKWRVRQEIIWDRGGSITLNARMFIPCDERIYWLTKGDFRFNDTTEIKSWSSVWRIPPKNEIKGVSAPFPNEIPNRCVVACSDFDDIVIDPYSGTGTTLIACEKNSRRCFGMEIEPEYVDVILDRWAKFTGKDPIREDGVPWSQIKQFSEQGLSKDQSPSAIQ